MKKKNARGAAEMQISSLNIWPRFIREEKSSQRTPGIHNSKVSANATFLLARLRLTLMMEMPEVEQKRRRRQETFEHEEL
jgi:hypothetical protein